MTSPEVIAQMKRMAQKEGSKEKDPIWNKGTPMPKDYTCHCGLYVHPSVRNPKGIHMSDCPYADKQDKE
jgi:ferredoxin-thioredoxin reductase catalytic subunit